MDKKKLPPFNRLIIAAYRLPYRFVRKGDQVTAVRNSGGLVSAVLSLSRKLHPPGSEENRKEIHWIGRGDDIPPERLSAGSDQVPFTLHPVQIPGSLNEKYYGGFCNNTIWPLFHYFPWLTHFRKDYWDAYVEANRLFAEAVGKVIRPGDYIWIHDYQLMLVPSMIREKFPDATIGFFLHIPFPSFEVFRLMPRLWRNALLRGVLGADLAGFHTPAYARYFYLSVRHSMRLPSRGKYYINHQGRRIFLHEFPIGIEYDRFHNDCLSPKVMKEKQKIRRDLGNRKLVFSVDRLDYTKGLLHRLSAYETFLEENSHWREKVVFNMVVIPSRDAIAQYQQIKKEIEATVGRINGKFSTLGWRPVIYQYRSLSHSELVAMYDASDVGLITPLRDGMNLVAKEYVASQVENQGVLILSEMAGAAAELSEAILINPVDQHETARAILQALEMPMETRQELIRSMQRKLRRNDVFHWAYAIFDQTVKIRGAHEGN